MKCRRIAWLIACLAPASAALATPAADPRPPGTPMQAAPVARLQTAAPVDVVAVASAGLPAGITRSPQLDAVVAELRAGNAARANERWSKLIESLAANGAVDVDALVQWVLRESYLQTTEDLRHYADKVKFYNDVKQQMRRQADTLKRAAATLKSGSAIQTNVVFRTEYAAGQGPVASTARKSFTRAELEGQAAKLEMQLNTVGDDAQLANVDLQNVLQKQQQTLQTMSNISKMLHDTAMAVIRRIGG